ncbi:MAG: UvrD-helicase domain-containing protein, partial [Rhodobacteraceae bacterium]|nr:UvrD-helicase domain-containing protein [Paracoccaceae bacterium]
SVLGAAAPFELRDVLDDTFAVGAIDLVRDLIPFLQAGGTNDQKAGRRLNSVTGQTVHDLEILEDVFLTGEKAKIPFSAKIGAFPTKATREAMGQAMEDALNDLMSRVETARKRRVILEVVAKTERIRAFARAFVPRYEAAKHARGLLDFDDLIRKARALLSDAEMAAWVLYKLDGQIDHILVDEAQDTSPAQWHVIRKLAEDFLAGGQAQSGTDRTLFVVGDKKQSIYSFQGADPAAFDAMKSGFSESLAAIGTSLHDRSLDHSFRSSPSILRLVDTVFDENGAHALGENSAHIPFHARLPGRVDMWPLVPPAETTKPAEWDDPVDLPSPEHHQAALATMIAKEIRRMLDDGTQIPEIGPDGSLTARRVEPRDFLILVQRRSGIFPHIIRACKTAELPIAGSDKLKVGAELAVRDLGAFLSFLATADDDLSLASCLRSPLFGWSEQEIYTLAHHRPEGGRLWEHLRKQADAFPDTCTVINDMRGQTDFLRPYDLLQRLLIRHGRRDRLIARLGAEAEDGINALLAQALTYESQAIPSLTGFLAWMQTDDLEIKRQIDSMSNQIRVMSVHGAKGLEAPIVILPDTIRDSKGNRDAVVVVDDEAFHKPSKPMQPQPMAEVITSLEAKDAQEGDRLLYVAMTRAE